MPSISHILHCRAEMPHQGEEENAGEFDGIGSGVGVHGGLCEQRAGHKSDEDVLRCAELVRERVPQHQHSLAMSNRPAHQHSLSQ